MTFEIVYPIRMKEGDFLKKKKLKIPEGARDPSIEKVREGFMIISYIPKNAKTIRKIGKKKILDRKNKKIKLPKKSSFFFADEFKIKKNGKTISKGS